MALALWRGGIPTPKAALDHPREASEMRNFSAVSPIW